MRRVVLLALAVALAVAAPFGVAASAATKVEVPVAGLSLTLPRSWKIVDAKTAKSAANEALAKENPQLAGILDELDRPGTGLAFFAFDPVAATTFATNVNVVTAALPAGVTIDQYKAAGAAELRRIPGRVGSPSATIVQVPGGKAVRMSVDVQVTAHGKKLVARVSQWAFLRPQKSVVVSFTTRVSTYGRYKATFNKIARSVRFA